MTRSTYNKYVALIARKVWTEREIISFRKMLRDGENWGAIKTCFDGRTKGQVVAELLHRFRANVPYQITPEQSTKGLEWLKRACFNKKVEIRNSKTRPFEYRDCELLKEMLPKFSHWTFDDVHAVQNDYTGKVSHYTPVYTLHTRNKREFSYTADPMGYQRGCTVLFAGAA